VTSSSSSLSCQLEMDLWEERWVQLQKELCQSAVVAEYAATSESPILLLECAWKAQEWDKVRVLSHDSTNSPEVYSSFSTHQRRRRPDAV
jgi:hypothetical protein